MCRTKDLCWVQRIKHLLNASSRPSFWSISPIVVFLSVVHLFLRKTRYVAPHHYSYDYGSRFRRPIDWLHITKTGTSLGNVLLKFVCKDVILEEDSGVQGNVTGECLSNFYLQQGMRRNWPIGDHFSLWNRSEVQLSHVYTMLRSPKYRFASGYHYRTSYKNLNASVSQICNFLESKALPSHFTRGHQVKTIVGHKFSSNRGFKIDIPPSNEEVHEACKRIESFAFVGVTELWNTSMCLLAHSHQIPLDEIMKIPHMRKGKSKGYKTVQADCIDPYDDFLVSCAIQRIKLKVKKHPVCLDTFFHEIEGLII